MRVIRLSAADGDTLAAALTDYRDLTDVALRRVTEPAEGLYIAESAKVIARAIAAGHVPRSVLLQERWLGDIEPLLEAHPDVPVYVAPAESIEAITGFDVHRGALASMQRPVLADPRELLHTARRVVVL